MTTALPLRGIITVLNTPFTSDDRIDVNAIRLHVHRALGAGVCGFLVPAIASEVGKLSMDERVELVDAVRDAAGGAVPVFAGTADPDVSLSKVLLKRYLDLGCTHVLFQIPYNDDEEFTRQFLDMAEFDPEVIMLQDWSAHGYGLPDDLIMHLFEEVDAFRCLKIETVPAGVKYSRILKMTGGALHVSGGWAVSQMIEGLRRGVHAFMPTGMHFIYTEIYKCYAEGNLDRAISLFQSILPVLSFSNQHLDISIHFFKRLLCREGIYPTDRVRSPSLPFDDIHEEISDDLIQRVMRIEKEIEKQRRQSKVYERSYPGEAG